MSSKKSTVMIVDDQPTNIQTLMQILQNQYAILAATEGIKALALAASTFSPDLILLDVDMPDMDGFSLCKKLKENPQTKNIPVIFVTAKSETIDEAKGLKLGAVDYIVKPVNPELVLARVYNHIELASYRKSLEERVEEKTLALQELNSEIEHTLHDTLFTLGEIAEHRSKETGHHVKRVSEYSYHLARFYGLNDDECETIRLASSLHDIGKIAIPDSILNKPGKLDEKEYAYMQQHAEYGYIMLKNSERKIFKAAAIVAHTHHEKWDGSGYPQKLSGKDIHIFGRITALADVFDAIGSDRCYKKAWPIDEILAFLKKESGYHFDPVLITHFFENLDLFLSIREQYTDM